MHGRTTWILVADGQRAKVYCNTGPGKDLTAEPGLEFARSGPRSHDMTSDKPGRMKASAGASGSSGMTPRVDPHDAAERAFAGRLAEMLDHAAARKRFDRLILAAAPAMLGHLRDALAAPTRKLIGGEIPKDLTKIASAKLAAHFSDYLAI